jgi:hypothetical protein
MKKYIGLYAEHAFSVLKYAIAGLTIVAGVGAMVAPLTPMPAPLGFLYGTRVGLVLFGALTVSCGFSLLYGKATRSRQWTGRGLMACYMCFVFATLIQGLAFAWDPGTWVANAIFALITGALFLRWKFKTSYIDPNHFRKEIEELTN